MDIESILKKLLPDAGIVSLEGDVVTIESAASGKAVFDAEIALRKETGRPYEIMLGRMEDRNVIRIRRAEKRRA